MKFLWICDPSIYTKDSQDVPTLYRHLSRDPRIEFFHAPISSVLPQSRIPVIAVPNALTHSEFLRLDQHAPQLRDLSEFDLVFCRRLKPFPPGYLDILSQWETQTRFVNSPTHKREQMTPSFLMRVAQPYIPDTLVTADTNLAESFFEQHQKIVAKTANSCGGRGVFKIWFEARQFHVDNSLAGTRTFETFRQAMDYLLCHGSQTSESRGYDASLTDFSLDNDDQERRQGQSVGYSSEPLQPESLQPEPLQFVRYVGQVTAGDKRIVVVDGEIYGAYIRRSKSGYWVNNVSYDGECVLSEVTPEEREAIEGTVDAYRQRGLHTLGYDFLLDHDGVWRISEINAGNIGGFARLESLTGEPICDRFLDWLIKFATQGKSAAPQIAPLVQRRIQRMPQRILSVF